MFDFQGEALVVKVTGTLDRSDAIASKRNFAALFDDQRLAITQGFNLVTRDMLPVTSQGMTSGKAVRNIRT